MHSCKQDFGKRRLIDRDADTWSQPLPLECCNSKTLDAEADFVNPYHQSVTPNSSLFYQPCFIWVPYLE